MFGTPRVKSPGSETTPRGLARALWVAASVVMAGCTGFAAEPRAPIPILLAAPAARVEQIAALRERILAATVEVPWIPALQKDTRTRNTHSSTAIEGNPLTLEQVRAVEEGREIPAVAARAKREVVNYFAALRFVEKNAV